MSAIDPIAPDAIYSMTELERSGSDPRPDRGMPGSASVQVPSA